MKNIKNEDLGEFTHPNPKILVVSPKEKKKKKENKT